MERVVDSSLITRHVGGDGVFATPSMIGLMEVTAHQSVREHLPEGQTTVGYEVCVRHLAPVDPGQSVVVTSLLTEVRENRLLFEVSCTSDGTLVGSGTHKRAIVPALSEEAL
jgi:fluoroacetyl-CoA thioesterase